MAAIEEVGAIKRRVDELKIKRARLQERLQAAQTEKERLMAEAQDLGIENPKEIAQWVEARRLDFEAEKARVEQALSRA